MEYAQSRVVFGKNLIDQRQCLLALQMDTEQTLTESSGCKIQVR